MQRGSHNKGSANKGSHGKGSQARAATASEVRSAITTIWCCVDRRRKEGWVRRNLPTRSRHVFLFNGILNCTCLLVSATLTRRESAGSK